MAAGPAPALPRESSARARAREGDAHPIDIGGICPYLLAADRRWRSARPTRDHRCTAVAQPLPLTVDKQQTLCLVAQHTTCARYVSAAVASAKHPEADGRRPAWGFAASTPVLLEPPGLNLDWIRGMRMRSVGQVLLGILMVLAFIAVVLARTTAPV